MGIYDIPWTLLSTFVVVSLFLRTYDFCYCVLRYFLDKDVVKLSHWKRERQIEKEMSRAAQEHCISLLWWKKTTGTTFIHANRVCKTDALDSSGIIATIIVIIIIFLHFLVYLLFPISFFQWTPFVALNTITTTIRMIIAGSYF